MDNQPLVSIIIPTFNRAHLIGETLDSVLAQTYSNWECIIVDDGSSDNTDEVVGEYLIKDKRFKYYHRPDEHLPGGNGARNYGFKMSKGDYVNWFDSDDVMMPQKIELKVKVLLDGNYDFVVCEGIECNEFNDEVKHWNKITSQNPFIDHIYGRLTLSTNGPLFKRAMLLKVKGFNEKLKKKQEWEYYSRLLGTTHNYHPINKILYKIRSNRINPQDSDFIKSKNNANILLYNYVKRNKKNLLSHNFKRHFLHKFISNCRTSIKNAQFKNSIISMYYALRIVDFKYILNFIKLKYEVRN